MFQKIKRTEDFSPFTDLLNEAEEEDEQNEEEGQEDEEDVEMINSSEEETEAAPEGEEKPDDPMGETGEDEPEAKRRRIANMIESITSTAKDEGVCLACGNAGHSLSDCQSKEDKDRVASASDVILSKTKKTAFPKARRFQSKKKSREETTSTDDMPERVTSLYPEEVRVFEKCAEFQGGHWTATGSNMNTLGAKSHENIVGETLPEMNEFDMSFNPSGRVVMDNDKDTTMINIEQTFRLGI